jgi:hypothetical protein
MTVSGAIHLGVAECTKEAALAKRTAEYAPTCTLKAESTSEDFPAPL